MSARQRVAMVCLSGFRVREPELLELGMTLPGLHDRARALGALPGLGLLTLAGATPPEWHVTYHEPKRVDDALLQTLVDEQPTFVALSALTASIEEAYALSRRLRDEGIAVVLGGLHVTALPDEASRHADAIVIGDGESVWPDVLRDARAGRLAPRYQAKAAFDLRDAPTPRYDLLAGVERPRFTMQTARGCPFACDFCGASRLLGGYRTKATDILERELDAIRALDPRPLIEFADDNTFAAGSRDAAFFDLLANSGVRYFTESDWRIGERPELLERLAASGCAQVLVGIESFVHEHSGMGAKRAPRSRVFDAIERIQQHGVAVNGCFIVGSDGEDARSLDRLAECIESSPLAEVQLTLLTPFPGTALYRRMRREGRLLSDRGWSHYTLFDVTTRPDELSVTELETRFKELMARVFGRDANARRKQIRREVWRRAGRQDPCEKH